MVAALADRETLDALIAAHQTLAIGFDQDVTETSRTFRSALEALAGRLPEVAFRRVARTAWNPLADVFGIEAAPALVWFQKGLGSTPDRPRSRLPDSRRSCAGRWRWTSTRRANNCVATARPSP